MTPENKPNLTLVTLPSPSDPVNVLTRSGSSLALRFMASMVKVAGLAIFVLAQSQTQLVALFPEAKWLGPLIMLLGTAWESGQKYQDRQRVAVVNYTPAQENQTNENTLP